MMSAPDPVGGAGRRPPWVLAAGGRRHRLVPAWQDIGQDARIGRDLRHRDNPVERGFLQDFVLDPSIGGIGVEW